MQLQNQQIHLWHLNQASFDLGELERDCLEWLTESELHRYRRFQFDRNRKQLLLGRMLLRVALSSYNASIEPQAWTFSHNDYGKPAISEEQNGASLRFNLSHSAQRVVLAVSRDRELGVDIELANKPRRVKAIAKRYFSSLETEEILALPEAEQQDRFYALWTLKEAYIKACGLGLAIPLAHFSYRFPGSAGLEIEFDARRQDSAPDWQLWQLDVGPDYKLALATKAGAGKSELQLSNRQLLGIDSVVESGVRILRSS